jgi:hypothetical protein
VVRARPIQILHMQDSDSARHTISVNIATGAGAQDVKMLKNFGYTLEKMTVCARAVIAPTMATHCGRRNCLQMPFLHCLRTDDETRQVCCQCCIMGLL